MLFFGEMLFKKVNLFLQGDIDTEGSNDAEAEAPEVTFEASDASEVNHAHNWRLCLCLYLITERQINLQTHVTSRFVLKTTTK